MKLYKVDNTYINKLRSVDSRVLYNKDSRPYLGVVLKIEKHQYFVPLSSPKENKKVNNQLCIKVFEPNNLDNLLGYLMLLNMIPVPSKYLTLIDVESIKTNDENYYSLVRNQLAFFRNEEQRIKVKAEKVYKNATEKKVKFIKDMCVNFKVLEKSIEEN